MKPKVLILRAAGTNCDLETGYAFESAGGEVDIHHLNHIKEYKNLIDDYKIICIPGGFTYGDDIAAGTIFSMQIELFLKDRLKAFVENGGLILGICNGFQVLVKSGMLPDFDFQQKVSLVFNDSGNFEDRWVYLKVENKNNLFFAGLPDIIVLPVAHAEGKFVGDEEVIKSIENNNQVAVRYVDSTGNKAGYPFNPNGAVNDIAGITDKTGRVFGLMPHPERFMFKEQSPEWLADDKEIFPFGKKIFENAVNYFK